MQRRGIITQRPAEKPRLQAGRAQSRGSGHRGLGPAVTGRTGRQGGRLGTGDGAEFGIDPREERCVSFCSDSSYCTLSFSVQSLSGLAAAVW